MIKLYMVSTHIHLYMSFFIQSMCHRELTHMVIIPYVYQYVPKKYHLHMYVIYTRIYMRIYRFLVYIPDHLVQVMI